MSHDNDRLGQSSYHVHHGEVCRRRVGGSRLGRRRLRFGLGFGLRLGYRFGLQVVAKPVACFRCGTPTHRASGFCQDCSRPACPPPTNDHLSRPCGCNVLTGRCFRHGGWWVLAFILVALSFPFVAFAVMVWLHGPKP